MLLLFQLFHPTFEWKQEQKLFSVHEMKWKFHFGGHPESNRISSVYFNSLISCSNVVVFFFPDTLLFFLTGYFLFQHRPQKQPTSATPIMPYECTSWKWFGMDLAGSEKTGGSNDWNPSMRHQCCLWTRGWTFFLDIL